MSQKIIWALLDERQGNTSQTLGVAEKLGLPYVEKNIRFNPFIRMPNFLLNSNTLGISKSTVGALHEPWPDIVISTARRLAIVASYIKSQNPKTFLAQIQWPGTPSSQFDLIAAPLHDEKAPGGNVITTFGAPHRVTLFKLAEKAQQWREKLSHLPSPRIAVLVGGSARSREFADKQVRELADQCSNFAKAVSGSLMVTTSRRTGEEATRILADNLRCPHYLHSWNDADPAEANPYFAFLGLADIVIATGESVSMCSEACATGKPVYVFESEGFISTKQQKFLHSLYDNGLAKPLQTQGNTLYTPKSALDDAAIVAEAIRRQAF